MPLLQLIIIYVVFNVLYGLLTGKNGNRSKTQQPREVQRSPRPISGKGAYPSMRMEEERSPKAKPKPVRPPMRERKVEPPMFVEEPQKEEPLVDGIQVTQSQPSSYDEEEQRFPGISLLEGPNALIEGIVLSEILSPPLALRGKEGRRKRR